MTPDLRVVLSLWLNSWQKATQLDALSNDADRLRQLPGVIAELGKASSALYAIADEEVEAPPDESDEKVVVAGCVVPNRERTAVMVLALIEWEAAHNALDKATQATREMYSRIEQAEQALRRFLSTGRRRAVTCQGATAP